MVKFETIIKTIEKALEEDTIKCPATTQAKNIGKTAQWREDDDGNNFVTFDDGTEIQWDGERLKSITYNGKKYDYLNPDVADDYEEEDRRLMISSEMEQDADIPRDLIFDDMDDMYTFGGDIDNMLGLFVGDPETLKYLSQQSNGKLTDSDRNSLIEDDYDYWKNNLLDHEPEFREAVSDNQVIMEDNGYVTQQSFDKLPSEFSKDNRIVTNQNYELEKYGQDESWFVSQGRGKEPWTVLTIRDNDNPANTGYPIDVGSGVPDGNHQILTEPGHKNERVIIDERDKLIVQIPHKATA